MMSMRGFLLAASALMLVPVSANAHSDVIASIKPVHSLVAAVMEGVGEPELIIDGAGSPHTYALKPSQAADLEKAGLVFWVGPELEAFLQKPIETIGSKAVSVQLLRSHDLTRLDLREGGTFEGHDHGEHGHGDHGHEEAGHEGHDHAEKHDDHAHEGHDHAAKHDDHAHEGHDHAEKHDDHAHEGHDHAAKHDDHAHEGHDHAGHAHGHDAVDAHIWLDPQNAKALVHEIEEALVAHDPANAAKYEANAEALMARLDDLTAEIKTTLEPVKDKPFVVFHDAYHYFENRFGLTAAGSITVSPEVIPGARRVGEIQGKLKELDAACVFSEPQFEPKLVTVVTDGTNAKSGVLDPLGAGLDNGPSLYFELLRGLASSFRDCLAVAS